MQYYAGGATSALPECLHFPHIKLGICGPPVAVIFQSWLILCLLRWTLWRSTMTATNPVASTGFPVAPGEARPAIWTATASGVRLWRPECSRQPPALILSRIGEPADPAGRTWRIFWRSTESCTKRTKSCTTSTWWGWKLEVLQVSSSLNCHPDWKWGRKESTESNLLGAGHHAVTPTIKLQMQGRVFQLLAWYLAIDRWYHHLLLAKKVSNFSSSLICWSIPIYQVGWRYNSFLQLWSKESKSKPCLLCSGAIPGWNTAQGCGVHSGPCALEVFGPGRSDGGKLRSNMEDGRMDPNISENIQRGNGKLMISWSTSRFSRCLMIVWYPTFREPQLVSSQWALYFGVHPPWHITGSFNMWVLPTYVQIRVPPTKSTKQKAMFVWGVRKKEYQVPIWRFPKVP